VLGNWTFWPFHWIQIHQLKKNINFKNLSGNLFLKWKPC
jgi:hypothetical protein